MRRNVVGKVECWQCDQFFGIATDDGDICAEPDCHEPSYDLDPSRPAAEFAVCPGRREWQKLRDRVTVRSSGNTGKSNLPGIPNSDDNQSLDHVIRGLEETYGSE